MKYRIHIRRHIGRFLVPGSAQSRVKRVSKIGLGCSGHYSVKVLKKSLFFFSQPWSPQTILIAWLSSHWKSLSFYPVLTPILSTYSQSLSSSHTHLVHLQGTFSEAMAGSYETHPKPSLLQTDWDQRNSSHQFSLIGQILQSLSILGIPDSSPPPYPQLPRNMLVEELVFPRTGVMLTSR